MTERGPAPNWTDRLRTDPYAKPDQLADASASTPLSATRYEPAPKSMQVQPVAPPLPRAIEINLALPKLNLPALRHFNIHGQIRRIHLSRRAYAALGIAVLAILIGASLLYVHSRVAGSPAATTAKHMGGPVRATPNYSTITPNSKSVDSLGGWYRISPPGRDPVYAFVDHVDSVQVDVSEQPLPASFKNNTAEAVAQLAQGFGATQKLTIGSITAYLGTSAQGPQSIIYTRDNLLMLIKSTDKLTTDQWTQYISNLH